MQIIYILTLLSSAAGGACLLFAFIQPAAPGQAALAATACGLAVIPYVFARSIQLIIDRVTATSRHQELLRALERISALPGAPRP